MRHPQDPPLEPKRLISFMIANLFTKSMNLESTKVSRPNRCAQWMAETWLRTHVVPFSIGPRLGMCPPPVRIDGSIGPCTPRSCAMDAQQAGKLEETSRALFQPLPSSLAFSLRGATTARLLKWGESNRNKQGNRDPLRASNVPALASLRASQRDVCCLHTRPCMRRAVCSRHGAFCCSDEEIGDDDTATIR